MPSKEDIRPKVETAFAMSLATRSHPKGWWLSRISQGVDAEPPKDDIFVHLGMGSLKKLTMEKPLSDIALSYQQGVAVTETALSQCESVRDCINLTTKCANGG